MTPQSAGRAARLVAADQAPSLAARACRRLAYAQNKQPSTVQVLVSCAPLPSLEGLPLTSCLGCTAASRRELRRRRRSRSALYCAVRSINSLLPCLDSLPRAGGADPEGASAVPCSRSGVVGSARSVSGCDSGGGGDSSSGTRSPCCSAWCRRCCCRRCCCWSHCCSAAPSCPTSADGRSRLPR